VPAVSLSHYCSWLRVLLHKLYSLKHLEVVHLKIDPNFALNYGRQFFSSEPQSEAVDKEVMALIFEILSKMSSLRVWNFHYPLKAKYLKTFANQAVKLLFGDTSLELFYNIEVSLLKQFYSDKSLIKTDVDSAYEQISSFENGWICDNLGANFCFTGMLPCLFALVIKKLLQAPDKYKETLISLDGGPEGMTVKEISEGV